MDKHILNEIEAAEYIGMSVSYLQSDRCYSTTGRTPGPSYIKAGRKIKYLKKDLDDWLERNRVERG